MSEVLTAAAQALNAPEVIVQRSAEARAKATGASVDEILAAWAGGEPVATSPQPTAPSPQPAASPPPSAPSPQPEVPPATAGAQPEEPAPEASSPQSSVLSPPVEPAAAVERLEEGPAAAEEIVPAAPLRERIRLAGRIGAVVGSVLGVLGILLASPWLLPAASVVGSEGAYNPAVEVASNRFILSVILLSIVFGVVVATITRGLTGWMGKGMALTGRYATTVALGIVLGAALGAMAGGVLTSAFGQPIETLPGLVALAILPAMIVVLIGGAILGWITAATVQAVGVPAGLSDEETTLTLPVRRRLGSAVGIPFGALIGLGLLVLPLALVLIRSNEMARGAAALVAVVASGSVLAFAGLSASRPGMRITVGEFLMATAGIGVIIVIIVAVFLARSAGEETHAEESAEESAVETTETTAPTETTEGIEAAILRLAV